MQQLQQLIFQHLTKYPGMQMQDCIKLVYQSIMGPGHLVADITAFKQNLVAELALPGLLTAQPQQPEALGSVFSRVYLSGFDKGPSVDTFTRMCALSAEKHPGDDTALPQAIASLRHVALAGSLPYAPAEAEAVLDAFAANGYQHPSHSERYRGLFRPHYRVLARALAFYLPVFAAVDAALAQKPHVLVGIDGMSGAGKSHLAALLQEVYGCGVVHTDDFFLRPNQRTAERLAAPGGNIDYERLTPVAAQAADDRAFSYQRYDCQTGEMGGWCNVPKGRLTVLEGVYALHPAVGAQCDVRVFLRVEAQVQARRVLQRSGPALAKRFEAEWIPMENRYFTEFQIQSSCGGLQLDTGGL